MPRHQSSNFSEIKTYSKGANRDLENEMMASDEASYVDAHNMRPTSMDGDSGAIKKIKGEEILFPIIENSCSNSNNFSFGKDFPITDYCNIGTIEINDNIIEFWVSRVSNGNFPIPNTTPVQNRDFFNSLIRINGVIVMSDDALPLTSFAEGEALLGFNCNFPLQMDKDESCKFGTVFVTDNNVPPIYFDIEDLIKNAGLLDANGDLIARADGFYDSNGDFQKDQQARNSDLNIPRNPNRTGQRPPLADEGNIPVDACTERFFSDFNKDIFDVDVESGLDIPVFAGVTDTPSGRVLGSNGLPVGTYRYSIRYVTDTGERTQWSVSTNLIPMPASLDSNSKAFPFIRTYGADSDNSPLGGKFAIHLKLRVTNDFGYNFIELRRTSYNSATLPNAFVAPEIIAKIPTQGTRYQVLDIFDNGADPIETVAGEDVVGGNQVVDRAKGIRYHNDRIYLMNVKTSSRSLGNTALTTNPAGIDIGATVQKIGKASYSEAINFEKFKTNIRGEVYKYAFIGFDAQGEVTFAEPIGNLNPNGEPQPFEMPNRRDEVTGTSLDTSYTGTVKAGTLDSNNTHISTQTYEVFDHADAIQRNQDSTLIQKQIDWNTKSEGITSRPFDNDSTDNINIVGRLGDISRGSFLHTSQLFKDIVSPTSQNDSNFSGIDLNRNNFVYKKNSKQDLTPTKYNPKCFALDYYSQGVYIDGLDNVENLDISSFSIVRTDSLGKVVAQGLACYSLQDYVGGTGFKSKLRPIVDKKLNTISFYSPDTDGDITSLDPLLLDSIRKAPQNYEIEVVAPLGYFVDVLSHSRTLNAASSSDTSEVMVFPRIVRDDVSTSTSSVINPEETSDFGFPDTQANPDIFNYVNFGKFRNIKQTNNKTTTSKIYDIQKISNLGTNLNKTFIGGNAVEIELDSNIWSASSPYIDKTQLLKDVSYDDDNIKDFHEPMYIVNIRKKSFSINDFNDSDQFVETGHYQKLESIIGEGTNGNLVLPLTYERWEDCIPNLLERFNNSNVNLGMIISNFFGTAATPLTTNSFGATIYTSGNLLPNAYDRNSTNSVPRFIYVNGQAWIHRFSIPVGTNESVIATNISNNIRPTIAGEEVFGIYNSSTSDNIFFNIDFENTSGNTSLNSVYLPTQGARITVRYNSQIPTRVFGGDGHIGESTFKSHSIRNVTQDPTITAGNPNRTIGTRGGFPFIYPAYLSLGVREQTQGRSHSSLFRYLGVNSLAEYNKSFNFTRGIPSGISSFLYMFAAESRTNTNFAYNNPSINRTYYPLVGYNHRFLESDDTLGYKPNVNIDYSKQSSAALRKYFKRSAVAQDEVTEFCSRVLWSLPKNPDAVDTPSLRTFPALNFFPLPESKGEIKMAWSANTGRGSNLYAITEEGTALLLTNKRTLSEGAGNELGFIGDENSGVTEFQWVSTNIGMNKEFWRTATEYSNTLYWANKDSVYRFDGNAILDIGKQKYHSKIYLNYLERLDGGKDVAGNLIEDMTGFYDEYHNEYWVTFSNFLPCPQSPVSSPDNEYQAFTEGAILDAYTLVYSELSEQWLGTYGYNFDRYVSVGNKSYGVKDAGTFELNVGQDINGDKITAHILGIASKNQMRDKEFVRFRVNSNTKPDTVSFYKTLNQYISNSPLAILSSNDLRDYYGFEQYVPRQISNRNRMQGRTMLFHMSNKDDKDFKVIDTEVKFKILK